MNGDADDRFDESRRRAIEESRQRRRTLLSLREFAGGNNAAVGGLSTMTEKLLSLLENKDSYHELVRYEIDASVDRFLAAKSVLTDYLERKFDRYEIRGGDDGINISASARDELRAEILEQFEDLYESLVREIESRMDQYAKRCAPLIEGSLPVPVPIRNTTDELLEEMTGANGRQRRAVTVSDFVTTIGAMAYQLMYVDGEDGLDSDRDTEEELENIARMYPEMLQNDE